MDVVTTSEAAIIKGTSQQSVYDAIKTGKIIASRSGKVYLIRRGDLDKWQPIGHRPRKRPEEDQR